MVPNRLRKIAMSNCRFKVCAREAGCLVGESPTGRVRRFTTEESRPGRGREAKPQAGRLRNRQVATIVNLIK